MSWSATKAGRLASSSVSRSARARSSSSLSVGSAAGVASVDVAGAQTGSSWAAVSSMDAMFVDCVGAPHAANTSTSINRDIFCGDFMSLRMTPWPSICSETTGAPRAGRFVWRGRRDGCEPLVEHA
jgi:hypothetical protein